MSYSAISVAGGSETMDEDRELGIDLQGGYPLLPDGYEPSSNSTADEYCFLCEVYSETIIPNDESLTFLRRSGVDINTDPREDIEKIRQNDLNNDVPMAPTVMVNTISKIYDTFIRKHYCRRINSSGETKSMPEWEKAAIHRHLMDHVRGNDHYRREDTIMKADIIRRAHEQQMYEDEQRKKINLKVVKSWKEIVSLQEKLREGVRTAGTNK